MEDYITATVHFVTADWRMSSFVLTTAGFAQHPTTANIGSRLVEIAEEAGVVGKVSAVVHDKAANKWQPFAKQLTRFLGRTSMHRGRVSSVWLIVSKHA